MPDKTEIKTLPTQISKNSFYNFTIEESGIYLIEIIASCKNWRQKWKRGFNDDDMAIKIGDIEFPKLNGRNGLLSGEAAWNGNDLKGAKKIGIFILELNVGSHKINFIPNKNPLVYSVNIKKIESNIIEYTPAEGNKQAEDGNNRQWITIALNNLPLKNLYINAKAGGESRNRDDIKLIIDGEIQKNPSKSPKYKNWYWAGNLLAGQSLEFNKDLNLPKNLHYIELWADEMPSLEKIAVDLKEK